MSPFRQGLALLALWLLSLASWAQAGGPRIKGSGNTVRFNLTLTYENWAPAGIYRKMILTNGQFPGPSLDVRQGDDVEVLVDNQLPWGSTIHFHGISQMNTPWSDGTPGLSQKPIPPGGRFLYKWRATDYGSYWYHDHSRGHLEDGLYGPIYIRPDDSIERPFRLITGDKKTLHAMHKAEEKVTSLFVSDYRQIPSEEVWEYEEKTGLDAVCVNALLLNGKGSISCLGRQQLDEILPASWKSILGDISLTDIGCVPPTNNIIQENFPHNLNAVPAWLFQGCIPSQGPTEHLIVDPCAKYVSYNLISAAGLSAITFSIDEHPMYVYAVDGRYVEPVLVDAVIIHPGSRYSVLVKLDQPAAKYAVRLANGGINQIINTTAIMSYKANLTAEKGPSTPSIDITGSAISDNYTLLNETTIVPFPVEVPCQEVAETHILDIDHYNASYRWIMGNASYPLSLEENSPLLFNPWSAQHDLSIKTRNGTWVDLIFRVRKPTQPPHPIHKHSNKYFVIGQGDGYWNYTSVAEAMKYIPESFNFINPQMRDTFVTPAAALAPSWLAIRYQVVNPGAFLLHCHIQIHQSGGMKLALLDGVDQWPQVPEEYRGSSSGFKPGRPRPYRTRLVGRDDPWEIPEH